MAWRRNASALTLLRRVLSSRSGHSQLFAVTSLRWVRGNTDVALQFRSLHSCRPAQRADEPLDSSRRSRRFNFVAEAAEIAAPAVVFVEVRARDYWSGQLMRASSGSGFIVSDDGTVLTNAHVVASVQQACFIYLVLL